MSSHQPTLVLLASEADDAKLRECMLRAIQWCQSYRAWNQLRSICPDAVLPFPFNLSQWQLKRWLEMEASLEIRRYDCCINGRLAYTGELAESTFCGTCKEKRYRYVRHVVHWDSSNVRAEFACIPRPQTELQSARVKISRTSRRFTDHGPRTQVNPNQLSSKSTGSDVRTSIRRVSMTFTTQVTFSI